MNRILFESSEIADGVATCSDARAEHILSVLHDYYITETPQNVVSAVLFF